MDEGLLQEYVRINKAAIGARSRKRECAAEYEAAIREQEDVRDAAESPLAHFEAQERILDKRREKKEHAARFEKEIRDLENQRENAKTEYYGGQQTLPAITDERL